MTKKLFSKIMILVFIASFFGAVHLVNAVETSPLSQTSVLNFAPVISVAPTDDSDDGASVGDPTNDGSNVTFTVTAKDINSDQYFLAICPTDDVTVGAVESVPNPPTCASTAWAVSGATASEAGVTGLTYATNSGTETGCTSVGVDNDELCAWYAFVCENLVASSPPLCFPADAAGDQGFANGIITFSDVPADQSDITIDTGQTYEFDNGGSCIHTPTVCINTATHEDGEDTATALAAAATTANVTTHARANIVYVYATAKGSAGNAIPIAATGGYSCDTCTFSDTTLTDVTDIGSSPFVVNHAPQFDSVTIDDGSGSIEPGEDVYFDVVITDGDNSAAQDLVDMHVCLTDAFTPGSGCASSQTLCVTTGVNPSGNATCDTQDLSGDVAAYGTYNDIPTTHGTKTVYIFLEDNHDMQGTYASGTQTRTYSVTDTPPVLEGTTGGHYPSGAPTNPGTITAGGTEVYSWDVRLRDDNGLADITGVEGVFFESVGTTNACSTNGGAASQDCYIDTDCDVSGVSAVNGAGCEVGAYTGACGDFTCSVTLYYNADAAATWDVGVAVTDDTTIDSSLTDNGPADERTVSTNSGIDVVDVSGVALTAIDYSTVSIGGTSPAVTIYVGNAGNVLADYTVQGIDMACDFGNTPNCTGQSIGKQYQKWHHTLSTFDWDTAESAEIGPWILDASGGVGGGGAGCVNRDLTQRADGASTTESNEDLFWKLRVPAGTKYGDYEGENTFAFIADGNCTGTQQD